jgi:2-oxoacid dehydrogenases acyltransferase (catalytic domain)
MLSHTGTFTISNLGMFGVAQFDAILPPGTGSILAIAASTPKVVQLKTGHFGVQKSMTVTITCDHRHIYGADAAEFLKDLAGDVIQTQCSAVQCSVVTLPPAIVVNEELFSGQANHSHHNEHVLNLLFHSPPFPSLSLNRSPREQHQQSHDGVDTGQEAWSSVTPATPR